jgi:hypothetical protein
MVIGSIKKKSEGLYVVSSPPCPMCGDIKEVELVGEKVFRMHQGAGVSEVLSQFDEDTRERFLSGVCPSCWDGLPAG